MKSKLDSFVFSNCDIPSTISVSGIIIREIIRNKDSGLTSQLVQAFWRKILSTFGLMIKLFKYVLTWSFSCSFSLSLNTRQIGYYQKCDHPGPRHDNKWVSIKETAQYWKWVMTNQDFPKDLGKALSLSPPLLQYVQTQCSHAHTLLFLWPARVALAQQLRYGRGKALWWCRDQR